MVDDSYERRGGFFLLVVMGAVAFVFALDPPALVSDFAQPNARAATAAKVI